jgi:hypothetical protein
MPKETGAVNLYVSDNLSVRELAFVSQENKSIIDSKKGLEIRSPTITIVDANGTSLDLTRQLKDMTTKHNAQLAALAAEVARAEAAESANTDAIAALQVIDSNLLADINKMLTDYQQADNSLQTYITTLQTKIQTLEAVVDTLLQDNTE